MLEVKTDCINLESWMEYSEVCEDCKLGLLSEDGECIKKCPSYIQAITHLKPLADAIGCDADIDSISRAIYKGTECGAWIDEKDGMIRIGSIVEGSDAEVCKHLCYPFTMSNFWDMVEAVNTEACQLWAECHNANGEEID